MIQLREIARAHQGYMKSYRAYLRNYIDPLYLFQNARSAIYNLLNLNVVLRLRIMICLQIIFEKIIGEDGDAIEQEFYFCSNCERILSNFQINDAIDRCFNKILDSIDTFLTNGSGWRIKKISFLDVSIGQYRSNVGGCGNVILPKFLKNKKCLICIDCVDNLCFLYSVAAGLRPPKRNINRASAYKKIIKKFKLAPRMLFPFALENVPSFENLNKIKINVYSMEKKEIFPVYISKKKFKKEVDLFWFQKHFFLIKNFNRLLSSKNKQSYFCKLCLNTFSRKTALQNHIALCSKNSPQKTKPPKNSILKFKNVQRMIFHPYFIVADFECYLEKIYTALPSSSQSYTEPIEKHVPASYAILALDSNDEIVFHEYFCGTNVIENFLSTIKELVDKLIQKMRCVAPLDATGFSDTRDFCFVCGNQFLPNETRVLDHDHTTGSARFFFT